MIGSDEFGFYGTMRTKTSAKAVSSVSYIETASPHNTPKRQKSQLLIDIVCPQPQSQRQVSASTVSQTPTTRTARTTSTNGWRK